VILRAVAECDARGGPHTVTAIAARTDLSQSTVRHYLAAQSARQLVQPATTNSNPTGYFLTDAGRATLPQYAS
jgi:DNA-binding IclR family transcriptional regulator